MRHFVVYPSADYYHKGLVCAKNWRQRGYQILIGDDGPLPTSPHPSIKIQCIPTDPFPGYYKVINYLVRVAFELYDTDLVTCIGDDMDPPKQDAQWIAMKYFERFPDGSGVLQGTGDRQGDTIEGKVASERICGSPTFGRGWWRRGYGGKGPFYDGYRSFYADEDLKLVAEKHGLLWQNPDITIFHRHWSWHGDKRPYHERASLNWQADQDLFLRRKAEGFPGSEPL